MDMFLAGLTEKTTKNNNMKSIYDWVGDFNEGIAQVKLNDKYGYIDKTGKEIIPCKYDDAWNFSEGFAKVALNGKYGCVNQLGDIIVPCIYDRMPFLKDGKIKMANDDVSVIYNLDGEIIF